MIIQRDTTPTKEFIRLIDTVIVKEEKIRILVKEISNSNEDSLSLLKAKLVQLQRKLKQSDLPPMEKVIVRIDTVHIPVPSDAPVKQSFLREYSEVKYLDPVTGKVRIHTISYPKYGISINTGYGLMLPYPYTRFTHGPYIGLGAYFRI